MSQEWEVVGGADKGGILIREGQDLKSKQCDDRLSTGAIVEQITLEGDRLHYKLVTGTGPAEGWASTKISGKELLVKKAGTADPKSAPTGDGSVDEALKATIESESKKLKDRFADFVMKYKNFGGPLEAPKLRVVCFHNAGSTESAFTGPGTPFFKWVKETKAVEVMAVDYPGRDKLRAEKKHTSIDTLAPLLLAVLYEKLTDGVPYCVWGHSVGTWVAFEFLQLARSIGVPMPKAAFLNAFPAPHMPLSMRPWQQSAKLDTPGLKEELLNWDKGHFGPTGPGKIVYAEPDWTNQWEPLMRADFRLFDEYEFKHKSKPPFDFPLHSYHMEGEHFTKPEMVEMWKDWTTSAFSHEVLKEMGHLTCLYNATYKQQYIGKVTEELKQVLAAL